VLIKKTTANFQMKVVCCTMVRIKFHI